VCREALFNQARRWYDSEELAASKDEFFDAELIPRRRAHRRLRKKQRASHRRKQRQQWRRAHVIQRRWLSILAKGDRKRQVQQQQRQHQQREQLEQKEVEMEAAEALLQEAGEVQAILKKQVTQLRSKVERQGADLRQQQDLQQQHVQQQQQCHQKPWEWSEEELLQLVDQQESELETAGRMSAEKEQQQQQSWFKISEQNLQMAEQQVHIETLERLLGMGESEFGTDRVSDRVRIEQCAASTQCNSAEIEEEVAQLNHIEAEKAVAKAVAQEEETEERFWAKCREAGEAGVDKYWKSLESAAGEGEAQAGKHKGWCELAKIDRGVLSRELANAVWSSRQAGQRAEKEREEQEKEE